MVVNVHKVRVLPQNFKAEYGHYGVMCLDGRARFYPDGLPDCIGKFLEECAIMQTEEEKLPDKARGPVVKYPNGTVIRLKRPLRNGEVFDAVRIGFDLIRVQTDLEMPGLVIQEQEPTPKRGILEIWDTHICVMPYWAQKVELCAWPGFRLPTARLVVEALILTQRSDVRVRWRNPEPGYWQALWYGRRIHGMPPGFSGAGERTTRPGRPLAERSRYQWETYAPGETRYSSGVKETNLRSSFANWRRARGIQWTMAFKTLPDGRVWTRRNRIDSELAAALTEHNGYLPGEAETAPLPRVIEPEISYDLADLLGPPPK